MLFFSSLQPCKKGVAAAVVKEHKYILVAQPEPGAAVDSLISQPGLGNHCCPFSSHVKINTAQLCSCGESQAAFPARVLQRLAVVKAVEGGEGCVWHGKMPTGYWVLQGRGWN